MRLVGSIGLKSEPEMEQEFEDALRFFDKDGRGLINAQHLKSALQSYGEPLENEDLNELIRMADSKGDGKIDYLGKLGHKSRIFFFFLCAIFFFFSAPPSPVCQSVIKMLFSLLFLPIAFFSLFCMHEVAPSKIG